MVVASHPETVKRIPRFGIIDPEVPSVRVFPLRDGDYAQSGHHVAGTSVRLDIGPAVVTLDPADLLR